MHKHILKLFNHIAFRIEEILIVLVILLQVLDFFKITPPSLDYTKNIISWVVIGYLLYSVSFTKIMFGFKHRFFDGVIVVTYFLFSMKNIFAYIESAKEEIAKGVYDLISFSAAKTAGIASSFTVHVSDISNITSNDFNSEIMNKLLESFNLASTKVYFLVTDGASQRMLAAKANSMLIPFFNTLLNNQIIIEKVCMAVGIVLIIALSVFFAINFKIKKHSMMHVLHVDKGVYTFRRKLQRILIIFIVLNAFFMVVFNLIAEWIAISFDSLILMLGLLFYLFIIVKHHKKFHPESFIFKLGSLGERFYAKFIEQFGTKQGIMWGISGLLVLHLLTDIGAFIFPYITGFYNPMYFHSLGAGHDALFNIKDIFLSQKTSLYFIDLQQMQNFSQIFLSTYIYIFNIIAVVSLLLLPAYIWYQIFKKRKISIKPYYAGIFFSSIIVYILCPLFRMRNLNNEAISGVDILTNSVFEAGFPLWQVVLLSFAAGIAAYLIYKYHRAQNYVKLFIILSVLVYFAKYVYYYFISVTQHMLSLVVEHMKSGENFIGTYFIILLMIIVVFYIAGFFLYLYEVLGYEKKILIRA